MAVVDPSLFISLTPAVNDRSGRLALRLILRQTSSHTVSRQPRMHGVSAGRRACLLDVRDNDAVVYVIYYSAPDRRVQSTVMSASVCLSVSLSVFVRDHIFRTTRPIFTYFCACYLWQLVAWHSGRTSVSGR